MKQNLEKMKQFIIKYDELFFVIIFLIMIIGRGLYVKTIPEDEMWNFQNIYKMYNGYKIYIDVNVITTPLFHIIGLILFKIFGANFFVFRIYNVFICLFLYLGIYKIFKALKINKMYSFSFAIIIFLLSKSIIYSTVNYNNLVITFVIYAILININKEKYKNYILYESILIFLIIITKQNVGIFYLIGYMMYTIINIKQLKENTKTLGVVYIFLMCFLYILFRLDILQGFINYCFLGIGEFAKSNVTVDFLWTIFLISIGLLNSLLILFIKYNNNLKIVGYDKDNIKLIACFAYPVSLISYPLFNNLHINEALILQYILLIYILYVIFKNKKMCKKMNKKYAVSLIIILIIIFNAQSIIYTYKYFNIVFNSKYKYEDVYFGTLFDNNIENKIENVKNYINGQEKEVIVLSPDAVLYMLPLKQNNAEMDLILLGNLGKNGENNIIEKVSKLENKIILINKEKLSYQESDRLREYVINNMKKIGEIEDLLIFETK